MSSVCRHESRRAAPTPSRECHGMTKVSEICHLSSTPYHLQQDGDLASSMRTEELGLLLTKSSNPESRPCLSPGQNGRAGMECRWHGHEGVRAEEPQLLSVFYIGSVSQSNTGELAWVVKRR